MGLKNLKILRKKRQWTQREVADMSGIHCTTYTKYETGNSEPGFTILIKLAEIFGTSTDYLLGRTEVKHLPASEVTPRLSAMEMDLISAYHAASPDDRAIVDIIVRRYVKDAETKTSA